MTFEEFVNKIKRGVAAILGADYEVSTKKVLKNNEVILTGLMIGRKGSNVTPAIYLNSLFELYRTGNGQKDLESIVKQIVDDYWKQQPEVEWLYRGIDRFLDYETIRNKIVFKLINTQNNRKILEQIPSRAFYDLSIVFMLYLGENKKGICTALIHDEHMAFWNVTANDLYEEAKKNTPRLLPETFAGISNVIRELLSHEDCNDMNVQQMEEETSLFYILTNQVGIEGAACLLYPGVLRKYADKLNCDLMILPSSIHETLLLPYDNTISVEEMRQMVQHINVTEVQPEDRLSGQVYLYKRSEDKIFVAV